LLAFTAAGAGARTSETGTLRVKTVTIDSMIENGILPRVDFVKMDIEGAESAALTGAANSIHRFKPQLAISVYHSLDDLLRIPLQVKALCPDYRLYLAHYTAHAEETVLYGQAVRP
jgi:hypothetical protein